MLVDAEGGVGAAAQSGGDLAALEVAEEFFPFGVGGYSVFLAGAQASPTGQERVGDEASAEVVGGVGQRTAVGGVDQAGIGEGCLEHLADGAVADCAAFG